MRIINCSCIAKSCNIYFDNKETHKSHDIINLRKIKIDIEKIAAFIDGTPVISDLQKQFYSRYLQARYDLILSPAYKLIEPQK